MKTLYESAIADMAELLEDTIENFSKGYEAYPMKPLFCVSNKQFPLMKQFQNAVTDKFLEYVRNYVRNCVKRVDLNRCSFTRK